MDRLFAIASICSLLVAVLVCVNESASQADYKNGQITFNVLDYGASGNGTADDSLAFLKTWNDTCSAPGNSTMIVPWGKTFFLQYPITFSGPCNASNITFMLSGTVTAPSGPNYWKAANISKWLVFDGVNWLTITGYGKLDGQGKGWWDVDCRYHPGPGCLQLMPTALGFHDCKHVSMSNIDLMNSPQTHILVIGCQDVNFTSLKINSPETSPNTDGIHITSSDGVCISSSFIGSGDDCISIGDYSTNITVVKVSCGPGHGISIGSLGSGGNVAHVETINVRHVIFNGTTNGARIKTWEGGRGNVRDVHFSDLIFDGVENPIIIDQNYGNPSPSKDTGVEISNVTYCRARGTSKTPVAINLNCSSNVACTNITLDTIELKPALPGEDLSSNCNNAYGSTVGIVQPKSCLEE